MDIAVLMLGFDTTTEMCTVAVGTESHVLTAIDLHAPRAHLQKLLPLAEQALGMCDKVQADVEAIAVGTGPGSLTGVRIGVATARTLAQAMRAPCAGISTLDMLAHSFSASGATVCVLIDAKRKEVYPAVYDCSGSVPRRLTEYRSMAPEELCDELAAIEAPLLLAGDGLMAYGWLLQRHLGDKIRLAPRSLWYPRAAMLLDLGWRALAAGAGDFRDVRPIYTRLSDAEEAEATRL